MASGKNFKGYYCKRCRTYTRLYINENTGNYVGICPKCKKQLLLPGSLKDSSLFYKNAVSKDDFINVWDHYAGGKIIGQMVAGTPAKLLETTKYNSVNWFKVTNGQITGWVTSKFIKKIT